MAAALVIVLATTAAYVTSFRGALVFDDLPGIANNPTIRDLSRLDLLLVAIGPQGGTLSGRPIPNLTLALNYVMSGDDLWSYHATNLLIHLLAALVLFGIVRRTLLGPRIRERYGNAAVFLAFAIALLWSLHPLQTESVTYLVQRVESLMGLFYLLTLYCFVRAVESTRFSRRWYAAAFASAAIGMGCKEVMVSAPLIVWLYDRTFVVNSWRESWRLRRWFYLSLFSTWIVLGGLMFASGGRGGTAGAATGIRAWHYAMTQCEVLLAYLRLAIWPHPLVFDRNVQLVQSLLQVWPQALALLGLLVGSVYLLVRRPAAGFLAAGFFLILAPTSSFVPIDDAMVEHRMYLPLAPVIALTVLGLHRWLGRAERPLWLVVAVAFGIATAVRNLDYRSPLRLWEDTVRKVPESARANNNLGAYLFEEGRLEAAQASYTTALRLDPNYASAHYNLAKLFEKSGKTDDAIVAYQKALVANPKLADAHLNLGQLLDRSARTAEGIAHYVQALRLDPDAPDVHAALGAALLKAKDLPRAIKHLDIALNLEPDRPETWRMLARAYQQQGDFPATRRALDRALQLQPDYPEALYSMANLDAAAGDFVAAITRYRRAVDLAPDYIPARNNLANALLMSGQVDSAIGEYQRILEVRPDDRSVRENLARALELRAGSGRP